MYTGSVVVTENSIRTCEGPQLGFAYARCARVEPGVGRPFILHLPPDRLSSGPVTVPQKGLGERTYFCCKWLIRKHFRFACVPRKSECGVRKTLMPDYSYIFFNKTPLQLRLIGPRGGRTFGRTQSVRGG